MTNKIYTAEIFRVEDSFDPFINPPPDFLTAGRDKASVSSRSSPAVMRTLLRTRDAARILNVSMASLERARWAGTGPDYYKAPGKAGAVRYELAALERWVADHRHTASPSAKQEAK